MAKANGAQLSRREMAAWRGLLRTHARVLAALDAELEQTHGLAVPEYEVLTETPLGRLATLEEVVRPALFLLSDEASYITGAVLAVDGGMAA